MRRWGNVVAVREAGGRTPDHTAAAGGSRAPRGGGAGGGADLDWDAGSEAQPPRGLGRRLHWWGLRTSSVHGVAFAWKEMLRLPRKMVPRPEKPLDAGWGG